MTVDATLINDAADAEPVAHEYKIRPADVLETSGDVSFVAALCLSVYAIFFDGPWQAPVATASYWLLAESVMGVQIWLLRREGNRLEAEIAERQAELAKQRAELEAKRKQLVAARAHRLHLELLLKVRLMRQEELRAACEQKKAELRERLMELGRQEERERLGTEYVAGLEAMAAQLDIRLDRLEARCTPAKLMGAMIRDMQEALEQRVMEAYALGYAHGHKRASFANRERPRLAVVNPSA